MYTPGPNNTLDPVLAKINRSSSQLNFFRYASQNDRIVLNSTPCDQNYTGSCQGLVQTLTPSHFSTFDTGRQTSQTIAQKEDCIVDCLMKCTGVNIKVEDIDAYTNTTCGAHCTEVCNQSQDFI